MKKISTVLMLMLFLSVMTSMAYADGTVPQTPIDVIVDYGWVIFAGIVVLAMVTIAIIAFLRTPHKEQIEQLRKWLLQAVIMAEKLFGSKAGEAKLSFVYDRFVVRFPWMAKIIKFDKFAAIVDEALKDMEKLLKKRPDLIDQLDVPVTLDDEEVQ